MTSKPRPPVCPLPVWKQAYLFDRRPLEFLDQCFQSMGDVFCLRLPGIGHWVFLCSPDAVRQLFKAPREAVPAGAVHRRFVGALFGKDATFNLDGVAHRRRQRLLLPLLSGKSARAATPQLLAAARRVMANWPRHRPFALLPACHRLSLEMLALLIFGQADVALRDRLVESFIDFTNLGARSRLVMMPKLQWDLGRFSPWGRVIHARRRVQAMVRQAVHAARRDPAAYEGTILGSLVSTPMEDGRYLGDDSLVDELMNLLFAGHETTGTVIAWLFETIASRPEVRRRMEEELDGVLGTEDPRGEELESLPYIDAVIQETFRFRPVGPFSAFRQVAEPLEIRVGDKAYELRPGDLVAHCVAVMSKREDLFAEAGEFRPERFLDESGLPRASSRELTPFGGGGRVCTGKGLALVELKIALLEALRTVDIELVDPEVGIERSGHMLAPAGGLMATLSPRAYLQDTPNLATQEKACVAPVMSVQGRAVCVNKAEAAA